MKLIKLLILLTIMIYAQKIDLTFKNLEINDFIKMVAKITNKNILLTNDLRGKVNFISVKPVNENEIYDILLNILRSKGYTLIKEHGYLKVIKSADAIKEAPPIGKSDIYQIRTDIIKLHNISAKTAYTQINYLKSKYGKIILNKDKNLLIITDYPKNLKIMKKLLSKIDTLDKPDIIFFNLQNTQLSKIYPKITEISNTLFNDKIYKYKIIKNDNSNGIILVGPNKVIQKILQHIKQLDTKPKQLDQVTEIITLKNSDVTNMAKIIQKIVSLKYKKNIPSITEDKETNSLIIIATLEQMDTIKTIIKALDIPKMQVYVKARILEISNLKASQIGNKLGLYAGSGTGSGLYTLSANMGGPAIAFDVTSLGLSIPTIRQGLALGATIDLLETFGAAKKLSEPSILCINNTPSTIYVGKTISVKTGQTTSTSTSVSYSRQDIGLTLEIKPRIDSDNKVSLNVKAVVEDILPGSPDLTLPTTSKRDIKTTTIVSNGQSIIIGGLVRNNKDITIKKVPFFGDIPIIGALFRHKEVNEDKTTLVIVLTPYIVKQSTDLDKLRLTLGKLNELERKFALEYIKKKNLK
ncbi:putative GspD [Nautilia profundicola AmH]|uniref:GspD n=1 Tax=Nautilia profundicola (strain ATCC BAA-1463 / DSM 18972 / AmH) TaxID=598659 RepID=B9L741_NAUPA|nr:secretin N-terminal domain-containing protein [Nautilia profundicola]ACM92823.1 putative GspD [Nautilia profundicola AmH]